MKPQKIAKKRIKKCEKHIRVKVGINVRETKLIKDTGLTILMLPKKNIFNLGRKTELTTKYHDINHNEVKFESQKP